MRIWSFRMQNPYLIYLAFGAPETACADSVPTGIPILLLILTVISLALFPEQNFLVSDKYL